MTAADTVRDLPAPAKGCPDCGARFGVEAEFCPFCGVALVASTWDKALDPLIGVVVDDRYEVIEPLGEGGMGTVYKVRHVTLNRMFAMKALRRDLAADPALSQRFIQEARATAAIKHPAVVSINDFGVLPDGIPYFVMELLVGETLSGRLRGRGPMAPAEAIAVARRIADGLAASHAANVIHRDLKPENVFLVGPNEIRIVDFGAAKIVGGSKLTRPGVVFGTPYYMSPEQASGQPIDARADVYSLGVLLFEMVTGRVPFEADTYMGVLTKHMFAAPPKPSERLAPGTQLGPLEAVVMRALEKDPAARYASMHDIGRALEAAGRDAPAIVPANRTVPLPRAPGVPPAPLSTADRIELSVTKRVAEEAKHKQRIWASVLAVAGVTAAVGIAAAVTVSSRPGPQLAPSSAPAASVAVPPVTASVAPTSSVEPVAAPAPPEEPPSATASSVAPAPPRPRPVDPFAGKPAPVPKPVPPPVPSATATAKRADDFSDPWRK